MAIIQLSDLVKVATDPPDLPPKGIPPDIRFLMVTLALFCIVIIQKIRKNILIRHSLTS